MIELDNVTFGYRQQIKPVVSSLSFRINDGDRLWLNAPSGFGKTTILRLIMGLEKPQKGKIIIDEKKIAAVFQEDRLIPTLSVLENVALFSDEKSASTVLEKCGLGEVLNEKPSALSGGMKRRVAIARAIARPADILIMDEPLTGLDHQSMLKTIEIINEYSKNKTLIIATHNQEEAELLSAKKIEL